MADIKTAFRTKSISLDDIVAIFQGNLDPRTNDQGNITQVPQGSLYIRNNGELYQKTGTANLAFSLITATGSAVTILDTDLSNTLTLLEGSNLTSDRTLTFTTGDASRVLTINGNATLNDWFDQNVKTTGTPTFAQMFSTGNVGIGTTSPSHLLSVLNSGTYFSSGITTTVATFQNNLAGSSTNIEIISSTTGNSTLLLGNTSAATVGQIAYLNSVNSMTFIANSAERMRIDSSGNVGIGTTGPLSKLHIEDTTQNCSLRILTGSTFTSNVLFATGAITPGRIEYAHVTNSMRFWANSAERMRITSNGNVGIGTATPNARMQISSTTTGSILLAGGSTSFGGEVQFGDIFALQRSKISGGFGSGGGGQISFYTDTTGDTSTHRMEITNTGNVGIGTTNPTVALDVVGDIKATGTITGTLSFTRFHVQTSGASATPTGDIVAKFEKSATAESAAITILSSTAGISSLNMGDTVSEVVGNIAYSNASDYMSFTTNGSEAMRIDSSGNVGIGTTTPASILDINKATLAGVLDTTALNITRSTTITTTGVSTDYAALFDIRNVSIDVAVQDGGTKGGLSARANIQTAGFAGILTNNVGVWGTAGISQATSGAAITRVYGLRSTIKNNVNGTTITDAYGVHITNNETGGTITNRYDLYASSANALNYFAGSVGIGTTNPTTTLDVNGAITASSLSLTSPLSATYGGTGASIPSNNILPYINRFAKITKTSTQNISPAVITVVSSWSSGSNVGVTISLSTGKFTITQSGGYLINAIINFTTSQTNGRIFVYRNSTQEGFVFFDGFTATITLFVSATTNDTIDIRVFSNPGATIANTTNGNFAQVRFLTPV